VSEIFKFEQTGVRDGKIEGFLKPTGLRPTFMDAFRVRGIEMPSGEYGIPPEDPTKPVVSRGKSRWGIGESARKAAVNRAPIDQGRAVTAGGMAYVSAVGPVDPETGEICGVDIRAQTRQCLENLEAKLTALDSSLDKVVWASWSLREPSEFDTFYEEWLRRFDGQAPMGQGTLMPLLHRRAGFRVSIGVIAATKEGQVHEAPTDSGVLISALSTNSTSAAQPGGQFAAGP